MTVRRFAVTAISNEFTDEVEGMSKLYTHLKTVIRIITPTV